MSRLLDNFVSDDWRVRWRIIGITWAVTFVIGTTMQFTGYTRHQAVVATVVVGVPLFVGQQLWQARRASRAEPPNI